VVAAPPTVKSAVSETVASLIASENVTSTVVVDVVIAESIVGATPSAALNPASLASGKC